jgi:hypothetical protein
LARALLGDFKTYRGSRKLGAPYGLPGTKSHALAVSAAFDHLAEGVELNDTYIVGDGDGALTVIRRQLLVAGIRLAFLLDQNFGTP